MKIELSVDEVSNLLKAYYQRYEHRNVRIAYSYKENIFQINKEVCVGYIRPNVLEEVTDIISKLNMLFKEINYEIASLNKDKNNYIIKAKTLSNGLKR